MAVSGKGTQQVQKLDIWGSIKDQDKSIHAFEVISLTPYFHPGHTVIVSLICSTMQVQTSEKGFNSGRSYYFGASSPQERLAWVDAIRAAVKSAEISFRRRNTSLTTRMRQKTKAFYQSGQFQTLVALLIFANFVSNATQSELQPQPGSVLDNMFNTIDIFFTSEPPRPNHHLLVAS
jgi:hypothetical protein